MLLQQNSFVNILSQTDANYQILKINQSHGEGKGGDPLGFISIQNLLPK